MHLSIQFTVFLCFLIISQVLTQSGPSSSLTCYRRFRNEELRNQQTSHLLVQQYHNSEITIYSTVENERCSQVGCVCFSYEGVCTQTLPGSNYFSECTDEEKYRGTINWHRGWTSRAKCEEMRQQPRIYINLTCCDTDRCNNQPAPRVAFIDQEEYIKSYGNTNQNVFQLPHGAISYTGFVQGSDPGQLLDNHPSWKQYENQVDHANTAPLIHNTHNHPQQNQPYPQHPQQDHYYPQQDHNYPQHRQHDHNYPQHPQQDHHIPQHPQQDHHIPQHPQQDHHYSHHLTPSPVPETPRSSQLYDSHSSHSSTPHLPDKYKTSNYDNNRVRHSTTSRMSDISSSEQAYDKSLKHNNAFLSTSFSSWIIFFSLSFYFRFMVNFY